MYAFGSGERKRMFCLFNTGWMSEIIEKIGEWVWILKHTCVNPALDCCAETACIYICRGSRCFEHTIDKTEQLIIPKYSRRATDDPCRTCCHRGCAGVNQAARKKSQSQFLPQSSLFVTAISVFNRNHTSNILFHFDALSWSRNFTWYFLVTFFYLYSSICIGWRWMCCNGHISFHVCVMPLSPFP